MVIALHQDVKILDLVQIVLSKVLLVGTKKTTYIGKPVVTNAAVHAIVEDQVSVCGSKFSHFLFSLFSSLP